jgi:hypothetical protein
MNRRQSLLALLAGSLAAPMASLAQSASSSQIGRSSSSTGVTSPGVSAPGGRLGSQIAPPNAEAAIASGSPEVASAYVLAHPETHFAPLEERAQLLRAIARSGCQGDPRQRASMEDAALALLKNSAGNPVELRSITESFGGRRSVSTTLTRVQNPQLREMIQRALN